MQVQAAAVPLTQIISSRGKKKTHGGWNASAPAPSELSNGRMGGF